MEGMRQARVFTASLVVPVSQSFTVIDEESSQPPRCLLVHCVMCHIAAAPHSHMTDGRMERRRRVHPEGECCSQTDLQHDQQIEIEGIRQASVFTASSVLPIT